jgi:serine/threonine-protein kinase HipA
MAPLSKAKSLCLWMNGHPVGTWESTRNGDKFTYDNDWIANPQGRPLSLSMPFSAGNLPFQGEVVAGYFDNLLPDSRAIRERIAKRYKTGGTSPFDLLAKLGRDCVGALQMLPSGARPVDLESLKGRPLNELQIGQLLREITASPGLGQHQPIDDLRLSIAGAQEKTALLWHDGQWLLPEGNTPTTHILKLPLGLVGNMRADMHSSVENEWLCSRIVAAYGLPVANCEIARFEDQKVLIVERFDRRLASDRSWILRLPQEDICQALGLPPTLKYEADGGPGIQQIMEILSHAEQSDLDRRNFFKTQIVFWLLAATDGHAKNFSITHKPADRYAATPLYDVLSAHPIIGRGTNHVSAQKVKLSMAVRGKNAHYEIAQVRRSNWISQGLRVAQTADETDAIIDDLTRSTEAVVAEVARSLPRTFPPDIADKILDGVTRQSARLANQ